MPMTRARLAGLVAVAALSLTVALPSVAAAQTGGTEADAETPGTETPDSGGSSTEAVRVSCEEASEVFRLLCDTHGLIRERFVDPVLDEDLASAAALGVRQAGLAPRTGGEVEACALPAAVFEQACQEIDAVADTAAAVWAATAEMVASLGDPFTHLMTPWEYAAFVARLQGGAEFSGIGIRLGLLDGVAPCRALSSTCRLVIAEVLPGSPAEGAGLRADDVIVELDGLIPAGAGCGLSGLRQFVPGTEVIVEVERDGQALDFVVEAASFGLPVAAGRIVDGDIGYLRLATFSASAEHPLGEELQGLLGAGAASLVFDLRGNLGGYLSTVVNIASLFLNDGDVVTREVSRGQVRQHLASRHRDAPASAVLPIVVAVDGSTASASELLSLALRDHGLATVVGATTFGKNTGQITQSVVTEDGTVVGAVRLTVFRWLSPDGLSAAGGIEPDLAIDFGPCPHPLGLARQSASAVGRPGAAPADVGVAGELLDVVDALAADGVLDRTQCEPGLFCPGEPITRSELAVWIVRVLDGEDPQPRGVSAFEDVETHRWWAAHVERLLELGVTSGCDGDRSMFCPHQPVSRAQIAAMLVRAFDLDPAVPAGFADTAGSFAAAEIDALFAAGITRGCSAEELLFCPGRVVSRAEAAILLDRARRR